MTCLSYHIIRLTEDRGNIKKEGVIQKVLETGAIIVSSEGVTRNLRCDPAQVFAYSCSTDRKATGNGPDGESFFLTPYGLFRSRPFAPCSFSI
jgi:hypothetical protein